MNKFDWYILKLVGILPLEILLVWSLMVDNLKITTGALSALVVTLIILVCGIKEDINGWR